MRPVYWDTHAARGEFKFVDQWGQLLKDPYGLAKVADACPETVARLRSELKTLLLKNNDPWADYLN